MGQRTEVINCSCKHEVQDEIYGAGKRLHNVNGKGEAFCTVCSVSYRRNKNATAIDANKQFGNSFIPARGGRNAKRVAI